MTSHHPPANPRTRKSQIVNRNSQLPLSEGNLYFASEIKVESCVVGAFGRVGAQWRRLRRFHRKPECLTGDVLAAGFVEKRHRKLHEYSGVH
jgi:hypothetical protein